MFMIQVFWQDSLFVYIWLIYFFDVIIFFFYLKMFNKIYGNLMINFKREKVCNKIELDNVRLVNY